MWYCLFTNICSLRYPLFNKVRCVHPHILLRPKDKDTIYCKGKFCLSLIIGTIWYVPSKSSRCMTTYLWFLPDQGGVEFAVWLVALTFQQHASVSQGWICSGNFMCCHTEIEVADQTFYLIQSKCTDSWPTSPRADPIMPGAWQGRHCSANF